eukprot:scaffold1607_cov54-Cyclotella_meneghiniana.AAC.2
MNYAISLLNENVPYGINLAFDDSDGGQYARVMVRLQDENYREHMRFTQHLSDRDAWNRLGAAIARNTTSLRRIFLRADINDYNRVRNNESDQCMEALFRGIEMNSCIEHLEIDLDLFTDEGTLPTLNLHDVQFKSSLKVLELSGNISENQSFIVSSFMENISLEKFCMGVDVRDRGEEISELALTRVILACTRVKKLEIYGESASQYAALASLLGNPRSNLSEMNYYGELDNAAEGVSTIAAGLASNTKLQILRLWSFEGDLNPIAKALCGASSIEGIQASNHTLQEIAGREGGIPVLRGIPPGAVIFTMPSMIATCLKLNKNANKEEVIRKKIARYYFTGKFDISPFTKMSVSVLPEVLSLIEGDNIYQQSAIFRMLKSIPELCNVSSRYVRRAGDNEGSGSPGNKRQKIENRW